MPAQPVAYAPLLPQPPQFAAPAFRPDGGATESICGFDASYGCRWPRTEDTMRPHPRPTRYNRYSLPGRVFGWGALALSLVASLPPLARAQVQTIVSPGNPRRSPIVEVVERVKDAVVNIHSERTVAGHE